jgi:hypothetical protein
VDWINLAQERVQWQAFVNTLINHSYLVIQPASQSVRLGLNMR